MREDLEFLALIEQALRAPDPKTALLRAFRKIRSSTEEARATKDPSQFERFMDVAVRQVESGQGRLAADVTDLVRELMVELATDGFAGDEKERQAALDLIQSHPPWKEEYSALVAEAKNSLAPSAMALLRLERDGEVIASWPFDSMQNGVSVSGVTPGHYLLQLDSGRVIWQGDLTERELVWTQAHPGEPLQLAAAKGARPESPTLEASILHGEFIIRVFARLESGRLDIVSGAKEGA